MVHYLDFEKPIAELEGKIEELRHLTGGAGLNIAEEVGKLQAKVDRQLRTAYGKLTPWQKVQVARHPDRPHYLDYVKALVEDYTPLAGDRLFGDDPAILGGIGRWGGYSVMVMGHEKGADTEDRVKRNFGMAKPEGYRKAQRLMKLADRFNLPVVALVDTAGAYPGVEAEARGQAEAIARTIEVGLDIRVPFISAIIGEGGSGGAIAIATANQVMMLEHSIYSVISPEGCASILWRSAEQSKEAAEALKLTAQDLLKLKVIDEIVPEPLGGAHRDATRTVRAVGEAVTRSLRELKGLDGGTLRARRREKFLEMGRQGVG
jgi:acetyl-CoA carboxylase carboxyl transferase subunit alpha